MTTAYTLSDDLTEVEQIQLNQMEVNQMTSLKQTALDYKPQTKTKVISDLQEVSTDLDLQDDSFEYNGKTVNQKVIVVDGEKYRVPVTVVQQLQVHLKERPELKTFKVLKSGSTKEDTKYTVVPIM